MIRRATLGDSKELAELWTRFIEEQAEIDSRLSPSADAVQRLEADLPIWLADSAYLVALAEVQGELVGFITGYLWSMPPVFEEVPEVFVEYLFVDRARRRQGIGRALVDHARTWGQKHHARRLRAGVLSANKEAIDFWNASGATGFITEVVVEIPGAGAQPQKTPLGFVGNS